MKITFSTCIVFFVFSLIAASQSIDNDDFVITHGPYLQNYSPTGVSIIWTTNKPAIPGVTLSLSDGTTRFVRNSHNGIVDGASLLHKVRIDGLKPGQTYKYSINSVQVLKYQAYRIYYGDTLAGKKESFTTPSLLADEVRFSVINDVHNNSGKLASYLKNGNGSNDFYIFNGDLVDNLQSYDQLFTGFIDTAVAFFASKKPFYFVRGNHEARGFAARNLQDYFDFRDNKFYYSFDFGLVHFVVLDGGEDKKDTNREYFGLSDFDFYRFEELDWLRQEVKSDSFIKAKYRIVIIHMPVIKNERLGYGMKFLADNFGPVLKAAGIDLMISAHTHRNGYFDINNSGFGYPVLINSNNSFVEVESDLRSLRAVVKDITGKQLAEYEIKK